jgi:hypothetical protein
MEKLTVDRGDFLCPELHDVEMAVLSVVFDYGGGAEFRACPPDLVDDDEDECREDGFFLPLGPLGSTRAPSMDVTRDGSGETRAATILESYGVVELARLDDFLVNPQSSADYLVNIDGNAHSVCSFTAHAVPKLREQGFAIEVDEAYPYRVAPADAPWYVALNEDRRLVRPRARVEVDGTESVTCRARRSLGTGAGRRSAILVEATPGTVPRGPRRRREASRLRAGSPHRCPECS